MLDESGNVLPLFLAETTLLVRRARAYANAIAVCLPDASEGIQAGEGEHGAAHASVFAE